MESANFHEKNHEIKIDGERDDVWDDELLINAYNKSVNDIKQKIAQRIGEGSELCDESTHKDKYNKSKQNNSTKPHAKKKWKAGNFCRAVYSGDGLEYEAQIVNLLSNGQCVVKYYGYDNKEKVKMNTLKPSLGDSSRHAQKLAATAESDGNDPSASEDSVANNFQIPASSGIPAIPPPPVFALTSQLNNSNESEALSAMLMSWYMSGYHTGYYQGLLQGKNINQKASPQKK